MKIRPVYLGSLIVVWCIGYCWTIVAQETGSIPLIPLAPVEQQIEIADEYFEKKHFLTPEDANAFDIYQSVLEREPGNQHAREKVLEMAELYKTWGDEAFTRKNKGKAKTYYERYLFIAEYFAYTLEEQPIKQELLDMQERLALLDIPLSPTPTPIPPPTPTPLPTPTPTPAILFQITEIVITDAANRLLLPQDDIYTVRLNETVTVTVNFTVSLDCEHGIAWTTKYGKVPPVQENTTTYTATKTGADHLIVNIWDQKTGEELTEAINILVIE